MQELPLKKRKEVPPRDVVDGLIELWLPFEEVSTMLSGATVPTLPLVAPNLQCLRNHLKSMQNGPYPPSIKALAMSTKRNLKSVMY